MLGGISNGFENLSKNWDLASGSSDLSSGDRFIYMYDTDPQRKESAAIKNAPLARSMRTVVSLSHRVGQVVLAGGGEALELLESGVLWLGRGYLYAISCAPSLRGIRQATMIGIDRSEAGSRYCCS